MEELHLREDTPTVDSSGIRPPRAYAIEAAPLVDGVAVVRLAGELDMAATDELRALFGTPPGTRAVVLDIAEVTFIDSAVLKELLRARDELGGSAIRLALAGAGGAVRRLLDLTRTAELFEIDPDAPAAVRRLSG